MHKDIYLSITTRRGFHEKNSSILDLDLMKGMILMKQQIGTSLTGDLNEAVKGFINPSIIILLSNKNQFKEHVEELEQLYPCTPSIGCVCTSYNKFSTIENGVTVIAFSECIGVTANVILELSTMPVKYISRVQEDIAKVHAEPENTICIGFCTGNDSRLMTTLGSLLEPKQLSLIGGAVDCNMVSCNGVVYEDACAYVFIKNSGKIKTYKETIYKPTNIKMVVTKADSKNNIIYELNGKPAQSVYCDYLNISPSKINTQTFQNPLWKLVGDEFYILSVAEQLIDMINKFDTKKSVLFENIDNMTEQLEPLLKEDL